MKLRLRSIRTIARCAAILPALFLFQTVGCLPDNAFQQVVGENIVFTSAIVIQSITAVIFNALFGFA